jgi:hypothetical protein
MCAAVQPGPATPIRFAYHLYPPVAFVVAVWFTSLAVLAVFGVPRVDIQAGQGIACSFSLGADPVKIAAYTVILWPVTAPVCLSPLLRLGSAV